VGWCLGWRPCNACARKRYIHLTSWKRCTQKFACAEFCEVRSLLTPQKQSIRVRHGAEHAFIMYWR
jgi:hypothetical protein